MKFTACILVLITLSIALSSCESHSLDPERDAPDSIATEKGVLEVKESGYDLQVRLSNQELTDDVIFEFDRTFGHVLFSLDENFDFILSQEETELSEIKMELESNALFTYKFYNRSDDELFYQCVLPDGTEMGYNLIRKTTVKGKSYIFKSNSNQDFSRDDIKKAQLILNKIS